MSIHAKAMEIEKTTFPNGRTADDGIWYGSGARALTKYPSMDVGRPGKTRDDRLPVDKRSRCIRAYGAGNQDRP